MTRSMSLPVKSVCNISCDLRGCGAPHLWLGCGRAELTGSDQSRDSGHSRESGDTSEPETVYDCIKSDLQVGNWQVVGIHQKHEGIIVSGEAAGGAPAPGASQERSAQCEVSPLPQHQVLGGQEVQPQHQEERLNVCPAGAGERMRACYHVITRTLLFPESSSE